jgi:hypothetical protein
MSRIGKHYIIGIEASNANFIYSKLQFLDCQFVYSLQSQDKIRLNTTTFHLFTEQHVSADYVIFRFTVLIFLNILKNGQNSIKCNKQIKC